MVSSRLKKFVVSIPVLGYLARLAGLGLRLPKLYEQSVIRQDLTGSQIDQLQKSQLQTNEAIESLAKQNLGQSRTITAIQLIQDDLRGSFNLIEKSLPTKHPVGSKKKSGLDELFADDHILDNFYSNFEDQFRGSETMITKRLEEYLPYFNDSKVNFDEKPVLDIGSGRGEFLQLLKTNKIRAVGLDINYDMVKRSKDKSLEAVQDDALTHLLAAKSQSYGAITGFHIVEHIPFNNLMRIFISAHRALVSNGFVIFETPNPENIIVASSGFYTDPTHLNPLPPDLLAFALKSCGFREVEILRLHPVDAEPGKIAALPEELRFRFYGPRDYAVIGYK